MAPQPTARLLAPALAGVAALAAAGVWFVPSARLIPQSAATQAPPAPPAKPAYTPPAKEKRWVALADKLNALREPWSGPDPTSAVAETSQPVVDTRIAWEYVGHLSGGGLSTAVVVINGQQRYVNEGEAVKDPSYPGRELRVTGITPAEISVDTGGKEPTSIKRKQAEPPTLRAAAPAGMAPGSLPNQVIPTPGLGAPALPRDPGRPIARPAAPDNAVTRQKPGAPFRTNPGEQPRPVPGIGPTPVPPVSPVPATPVPGAAPGVDGVPTPAGNKAPAAKPIRPNSTRPGGIK